MQNSEVFEERLDELNRLCRRFGVSRLCIFGSAAKGQLGPESDLDFVVSFGAGADDLGPLEQFFGFQRGLEELYGRPIDLVEASAPKNGFFKRELAKTQRELYAA